MLSSEPDPWRWRLRLFASADLVGSTAFKSKRTDSRSPEWASTFTEFFSDFPGEVQARYDSLPTFPSHCTAATDRLLPWKFLGDEILFSVELRRHEDAACHLHAFMWAIREFPEKWRNKNPLRLKGCAWLAGFPVTNREIELPSPTGAAPIRDYIGPSIDLGFRVSRYSEERRLALTADLALMLLDGADLLSWDECFYPVLLGKHLLKGVIGNEGYPIVFLHTHDGDPTPEEKLLGISHRCDRTALKKYLRGFIDSQSPALFRPFIDNDPSKRYAEIPEDIRKQRDVLMGSESLGVASDQAISQEPKPVGPEKEPKTPIETTEPTQ